MPDDIAPHPAVEPQSATGEQSDRAELLLLRSEVRRLSLRVEQEAASSAVQALRAGAQGWEAYALRRQIEAIRRSLFWRITLPLRLIVDLARGAPPTGSPEAVRIRRALSLLRQSGPQAVMDAARRSRRRRASVVPVTRTASQPPRAEEGSPADATPAIRPPNEVLAPSVLIVAELTLPQCAKYRVWQKQEHFARLGIPCRVVDWRYTEDCLSAAALATLVILYRVPGYPDILKMIRAIRDLQVPTAWEVDDLIFDRELFLRNRNLSSLAPDLHEGVLSGVELYRAAMLACDTGIASTARLADAMRDAGVGHVAVVENALDEETLSLASGLRRLSTRHAPGVPSDAVLITYGSGTKTHDADFREAAPALLRLLRERPETRLRIVGELNVPDAFSEFGDRVEILPPTLYSRYLQLLAESDINIAPLEPTIFNDAKSNIKFLEAAILGVASVCSPRANFASVVIHGENGLLADDDAGWHAALTALAADGDYRRRLGQHALNTALERYEPAAIAHRQVARLMQPVPDLRKPVPLRALLANIYYAPRSYGGATLVVEQMARLMHARNDTEIHIVTSVPPGAAGKLTTRTDQDGIAVFGLPVAEADVVAEFDDPSTGEAFGRILDAVQPDIVHLHAIQHLSASVAGACTARGIPYVVTVHDAWWLCARQFMVTGEGRYCFQTTIDLQVCQNCLPGARHLHYRWTLLIAALRNATLILSPSEAHRKLYLANGVPPEQIEVAPNGVRLPDPENSRQSHPPKGGSGRLRFAYVGGNVEVKGFSIVQRAAEALDRSDWQLILVDNTLNLGFRSVDATGWRASGEIVVVPAYTQDTIDDFFAGVDVLLFPSQWKESFGLTVREALARNVWVIATEGGGPAEAIEDGVDGTLIPLDGRHEPLAAAMRTLLENRGPLSTVRNTGQRPILDYPAQADALRGTLMRVAQAAGARGA